MKLATLNLIAGQPVHLASYCIKKKSSRKYNSKTAVVVSSVERVHGNPDTHQILLLPQMITELNKNTDTTKIFFNLQGLF